MPHFRAVVVHREFQDIDRALLCRESVLMRTKCMFSHWTTSTVQTPVVWLKGDEDWGYDNEVHKQEGAGRARS
jgi:hypothetical protein